MVRWPIHCQAGAGDFTAARAQPQKQRMVKDVLGQRPLDQRYRGGLECAGFLNSFTLTRLSAPTAQAKGLMTTSSDAEPVPASTLLNQPTGPSSQAQALRPT
jgi:hypothetical protein